MILFTWLEAERKAFNGDWKEVKNPERVEEPGFGLSLKGVRLLGVFLLECYRRSRHKRGGEDCKRNEQKILDINYAFLDFINEPFTTDQSITRKKHSATAAVI